MPPTSAVRARGSMSMTPANADASSVAPVDGCRGRNRLDVRLRSRTGASAGKRRSCARASSTLSRYATQPGEPLICATLTDGLAVPSSARYLGRVVAASEVLSQLRRGALEYCVLALLANEERYAFDIVRTLGQVDGMVTAEGTLYP